MAVTWIDTPGGALGRTDAIDFSTDRDVVALSVRFGSQMIEERAYRDGVFLYPYLSSTKVGGTFSLIRTDGWLASPTVYIDEAVTIPPPDVSINARLQPTLYSPLAQWALQGAPDATRLYADRSGNNRHLTAGTSAPVPDLIVGQTAIQPPTQAQAARLKRTGDVALALTGAMTVTCRLKRTGTTGCISVQSGIFGAGATVNTLCSLVLGAGVALAYQWEQTTGNMSTVTSPLVPPLNTWAFYSFRRAASGVPTFGLDTSYWTASGSFPVPPGGSASFLTIGDNDEVSDGPFSGAIADYCIWNVRLTDDELTPLRNAAMGLLP